MSDDDAIHRILDENRRLKQRVIEVEESMLVREDKAGEDTRVRGVKDELARLLKLLAQKDKILENYAAEIERKTIKMKSMTEDLRQRTAEAGRARLLSAAADALPAALLAADAAGRIVFANAAARALLGDAVSASPPPEAAAALQAAGPGPADDLRAALGGAEPLPRAVTLGGRRLSARATPVRNGDAVEGALLWLTDDK